MRTTHGRPSLLPHSLCMTSPLASMQNSGGLNSHQQRSSGPIFVEALLIACHVYAVDYGMKNYILYISSMDILSLPT